MWAAAVWLAPAPALRERAPVVSASIYAASALVCHQLPARSFHAHDSQLPVCARCAGLYLAGAAGTLAGWLGAAVFPRRGRRLLAAAALPTALTVALAWAGHEFFGNATRFLASLPLGAAAGFLFVRLLRADGPSNQAHPAPPSRRAAEPHAL